eukprot:scaffold82089_cov21-Tisochrysis_lutea.AAC.2
MADHYGLAHALLVVVTHALQVEHAVCFYDDQSTRRPSIKSSKLRSSEPQASLFLQCKTPRGLMNERQAGLAHHKEEKREVWDIAAGVLCMPWTHCTPSLNKAYSTREFHLVVVVSKRVVNALSYLDSLNTGLYPVVLVSDALKTHTAI